MVVKYGLEGKNLEGNSHTDLVQVYGNGLVRTDARLLTRCFLALALEKHLVFGLIIGVVRDLVGT